MINVSILRNGVRMLVVPIDSADAAKSGVVTYDPVSKLFRIGPDVITVEDLILTGDIEVEGAAMFRNDVSISGDLYVDGVEHINDSETVQTTGDYFILRHNNGTPLATGEHSGLAVFNYATNKTATLSVDKDGIWRIADNTASSTVYNNLYYFDGHYYDTSFVEQTFVDQIKTSFDTDEIADCVMYNNAFYHFDNTNWFAVSLVNNHLITDTTEITDATLIATLNALTKNDLSYFRRLQITTIVEVENQPLLTRDEASNLSNIQLLQWDAANTRAVGVALPTMNNTVLTFKEGHAGFDKHLIKVGNTWYEEYPTTPFTGTIPSGATQTADTTSFTHTGDYYYSETEGKVYVDESGTVYEVTALYYNADEWVDGTTSASLPADAVAITAPEAYHYVLATVEDGYEWATGGSGSVSRFATLAEAQAAIAITEGNDGYIPDNGIVIIDELTDYVQGEDQ